jgi:hypothetical protein
MPVNENIGGIQVNIAADTDALEQSLSRAKTKVSNWIDAQRDRKISLTVGARINEKSVNEVRERLTAIQQEFSGNNPLKIKIDASFKVTRDAMRSLQRDINAAAEKNEVRVKVIPYTGTGNDMPVVSVKGKFAGWVGETPTVGVLAELQGGATSSSAAATQATSFSKDADRIIKAIQDCCAKTTQQQSQVVRDEPTERTQQQRRQQQQASQRTTQDEAPVENFGQRMARQRRERAAAATPHEDPKPQPTKRQEARVQAEETGKAVASQIREAPLKTEKAPKEKAEEKTATAAAKTTAPATAAAKPRFATADEYVADPANQAAIKAGRVDEAMLRRIFAKSQEAAAEAAEKEEALARRTALRAKDRQTTPTTTPKKTTTSAPVESVTPTASAPEAAAPVEDVAAQWLGARVQQSGGTNVFPGLGLSGSEDLAAEATQRATPAEPSAPPSRDRDPKSRVCMCHGRVFATARARASHEAATTRRERAASEESEILGAATQARAEVQSRGKPLITPETEQARRLAMAKGTFEEILPGGADLEHRIGRLAATGLDVNRMAREGVLVSEPGREEELAANPEFEALQRDVDAAYERRRAYLKEALAAELSIRPEKPGKRTNIRAEALRQAIEDPTAGFAEEVSAKRARQEMLSELGVSDEARSGFRIRDLIAGADIGSEFDPKAVLPIPGSVSGATLTAEELLQRNQKRYAEIQDSIDKRLEEEGKRTLKAGKLVPTSDVRLAQRFRAGGEWNFGEPIQALGQAFEQAETPADLELVARQAFRMSAEQRRLYSRYDIARMQRDIEKQGIDFEELDPGAQSDFMSGYRITDKREQRRRGARFRRLFDPGNPRGGDEDIALSGFDLGALQTRSIGEISDVILALVSEVKKNVQQSTDQAKETISGARGVRGEHVPREPAAPEPVRVRLQGEEATQAWEETQANIRHRADLRESGHGDAALSEKLQAEALRAAEQERERLEQAAAGREPLSLDVTPMAVPEVPLMRGGVDPSIEEIKDKIAREHEERVAKVHRYLGVRAARSGATQEMAEAPEFGEGDELIQALLIARSRLEADPRSEELRKAKEEAEARLAARRESRIRSEGTGPQYRPFVPPPRRFPQPKPELEYGGGEYNPEAVAARGLIEQAVSQELVTPLAAPEPLRAGMSLGFADSLKSSTPAPSAPAAGRKKTESVRCDVCPNKPEIAKQFWGRHEQSARHQRALTGLPEAKPAAEAVTPEAAESPTEAGEPTVTRSEIDKMIRRVRRLGGTGRDIPTRSEAREYIRNWKKQQRVNVPPPEQGMAEATAGGTVPPVEVPGATGPGPGIQRVWVENWPSGVDALAAGSLNIDDIRRRAAVDPDFEARMRRAGILDEAPSARQKKGAAKSRVEEEAEEVAAEAETKQRRRGVMTRSQIAKEIGEVNFGQIRAGQRGSFEDMMDVIQDQKNFAREVLEENPVRALSVTISQMAVNLTGRADLKNMITMLNRSARTASAFAQDADAALANLRGAQEALAQPDIDPEMKQRAEEAVTTYQGLYNEAADNYEKFAGIPLDLQRSLELAPTPEARQEVERQIAEGLVSAADIGGATDPRNRDELQRRAETQAGAQEDPTNPQTLFGRVGALRAQRWSLLARTVAVATPTIVAGTALFTTAMTAFNAAMAQGSEWISRVSDEMSGFAQQANVLAQSLSQQALPTGRAEGGVRQQLGLAGIGGIDADRLADSIGARVGGEMAARRVELARDVFALSAQQRSAEARYGVSNFLGNFQPTGGMVLPLVGQTNIGAQPSIQETIANMTGDLPSRTGYDYLFSARENPLQYMVEKLSPYYQDPDERFAVEDETGRATLDYLTNALRRGGGKGRVVNEQFEGVDFSDADQARQAEEVIRAGGSPDLARRIRSGDLALVDEQGKIITSARGVVQALEELGTGLQTNDLEQILKAGARQLEGALFGISMGLRNQMRTWTPVQAAMQYAQQPLTAFGTGIATQAASPGVLAQTQGVSQGLRQQINMREMMGIVQLTQQAAQMPKVGRSPAELLGTYAQIRSLGKQIADNQERIAGMQVAQQMVEYNRQVFVASRNISDLRGLVYGVADAEASTLGILQKKNLERQREIQDIQRVGEAEQLTLNRRQINYQKAVAGFATPGMSPGEAAAQVKQAQLEADFQERQLNRQEDIFRITGEMIPDERKIVDEQNLRALQDALADFQIFQDRFTLDQDTALVAQNIADAQAAQALLSQDMQSMLGALQQVQQTETSMVVDAFNQGVDTLDKTAREVKRVFNEVAADFSDNFNVVITGRRRRGGGGGASNTTEGTGDNIGRYAGGFLGNVSGATSMIVGEAGTETVAVLRNPRRVTSGSGGGSVFVLNINSPSVRDDSDIETIARKVQEIYSRQTRLLGL